MIHEEARYTSEDTPAIGLRWLTLVVVVAFVALGTLTALSRGLWYDEAWSLFEGGRDVGFVEALRTRWLVDVHPPFFSMFLWLFEPLTGDNIVARRLLNIVPLLAAMGCFARLAAAYPRTRAAGALFIMLVLAQPSAMLCFTESRAYFAIFLSVTVLAQAFWTIAATERDYAPGDGGLLLVAFLGMVGAFSLQYIAAFEAGPIVLATIVGIAWSGRRRWALRLLVAAILAGLPVLASFSQQAAMLAGSTGNSWIHTGRRQSLLMLAGITGFALLTALPVLIPAGRTLWRQRRDVPMSAERRFVAIMFVGVALSIAALCMANSVQPMIVQRYLVVYPPFMLAAIAAPAAVAFARHPALAIACALYAVSLAAIWAHSDAAQANWYATARLIAGERKACSSTVVNAIPHWTIDSHPLKLYANEATAIRLGYALVGQRFGFSLAPEGRIALSTHCPTILWVEHKFGPPVSAMDAARRLGLALSPKQIAAARALRGETGYIFVFPPAVG